MRRNKTLIMFLLLLFIGATCMTGSAYPDIRTDDNFDKIVIGNDDDSGYIVSFFCPTSVEWSWNSKRVEFEWKNTEPIAIFDVPAGETVTVNSPRVINAMNHGQYAGIIAVVNARGASFDEAYWIGHIPDP